MSFPSFHVLIRADAGGAIGTGHVMRMIALGQGLRERGATVSFVIARCPDALTARLRIDGFTVEHLVNCEPGGRDDARQTAAFAAACDAKWIILDGYAFGSDYQLECRKGGRFLLCMDDHQYCDTWCVDALLNQNLHAPQLREEYATGASGAALWLGADFALLRKEFWRRSQRVLDRNDRFLRILITMGGADPPNATTLIMEALALIRAVPMRVSVLAGADNSHRQNLEAFCSQHPDRFEILPATEQMAPLLEQVDCVITAGGSTCWEVLWAGKPAAVLVIAENQAPIAQSLQDQGLMLSLGRYEDASLDQLATQLQHWLNAPSALSTPRRVDGKGARRVAAALDGRFAVTLATAGEGWLRPHLESLQRSLEAAGHRVQVTSRPDEMAGGDFLFLLSYWGIVPSAVLDRYLHSLVVHASDLPNGRGWSPMTWAILEGRSRFPICLLEADEKVDRGDIYFRDEMMLSGHELINEWRQTIASKTTELCLRFVHDYPDVLATRERQLEAGTYYPRRTPADSQLDPSKTIEQLFNQLRVADNSAYPAYFDHLGHRYLLKIEDAPP